MKTEVVDGRAYKATESKGRERSLEPEVELERGQRNRGL